MWAHNTHQNCICVVSPEDGQVMPETCQGFEPEQKWKWSVYKVGCVYYVNYNAGQQNIEKQNACLTVWLLVGGGIYTSCYESGD
jgi:hypothetical protein